VYTPVFGCAAPHCSPILKSLSAILGLRDTGYVLVRRAVLCRMRLFHGLLDGISQLVGRL